MNKRLIQIVILRPMAAALLFAVLFAMIYPTLWPEQARKPGDPVGYWIGSIGIPAVAVLAIIWGQLQARRENLTAPKQDEDNK